LNTGWETGAAATARYRAVKEHCRDTVLFFQQNFSKDYEIQISKLLHKKTLFKQRHLSAEIMLLLPILQTL
jgi:hypothetical protein